MSQGAISANQLMQNLVNAKKVMNKVDSGNFETGHVNKRVLNSPPEEVAQMNEVMVSKPAITNQNMNVDRINASKLPDVIKKAMIENPIPQISLNDTINMDFISNAKKLMEREGLSKKTTTAPKPMPIRESAPVVNYSNVDMNSLSTLIENTIRKVLDEKLNQILTAQQTASINENLVLKVGDSIFKGKITGVNKSK
jgi:hypothetical protein